MLGGWRAPVAVIFIQPIPPAEYRETFVSAVWWGLPLVTSTTPTPPERSRGVVRISVGWRGRTTATSTTPTPRVLSQGRVTVSAAWSGGTTEQSPGLTLLVRSKVPPR